MAQVGLSKSIREKISKVLSFSVITSLLPIMVVANLVTSGPVAQATNYTSIPLETSTVVTSPGFVELGALASRSKSTVAVKKAITKSSVSPYTITGTDSLSGQTYQYETLQNYTNNTLFESMDVTSTIVAAGAPNYGLNNKSWSFDPAASYGGRSNVNQLTSSMYSIPRTGGQAPYGSVFGPEVWSVPFVGTLGKSLSFDWAAANGQDDYEIYAFLVKIDESVDSATCAGFSGAGTYGLTNPTTTHTLMAYGRGTVQTWLTATAAVPSAGCYRFRFVSGTFDQTGGLAVGASLYVDNTVLLGDTQTITFPAISDQVKDASNAITINAGASSSATGATLAYSTVTSSVCSVNGSTGVITINANTTGTCTITVNSAAFSTFTAASPVSRSFAIVAAATAPASQNGSYISGTAGTCEILSVVEGGWNTGGATITGTSYQWQISSNGTTWTSISGATSSTYTTLSTDYNSYIRVQITKTNSVGASNPESTAGLLISTQTSGCSTSASVTTAKPGSLLTFMPNGADNFAYPQSPLLGETVPLWKNMLVRTGYIFTGWNTKADGTGTAYADQALFKFSEAFMTLHAQWKLIQTKPTISWATPVAIQEGTALSATQLNALVSVPGTYTYAPAATTALEVGKHTLKVTFVPTDAKYETIETTVEIEVLAKAKLTWANPAAIVEGTALSATQLNATASVPGTFVYSPATGAQLPVGKNTLKVTFTPTDSRLSPVTAEVTIDVTAKPVVVEPAPGAPVSPTYAVTGGAKTSINWGAGKDAATYTVLVDGKSACSVATLTCDVTQLLGPKNVVTVTSVSANTKTSAAIKADYVAPAGSQVLSVVNFDTARSVLKSSETAKLRAFASKIKAAGYTSLTVYGHTDSVGGMDNKKLSVARAKSTITYLKKLLPSVKFVVSGFAASEPVGDNSTTGGKAANRRAEIFIP
jgi:outer membrane protein OmpA-like peptidoglycan-associated protein